MISARFFSFFNKISKKALGFSTALVCISFILFFDGCRNRDNVAPGLTTLKFVLKDDSMKDVNGAKVYLFDNLNDWERSKNFLTPTNVVDSTLSSAGNAAVNIDPTKNYYLLVMYTDPKRKVTMLNVRYDSTIQQLPGNIDITVQIRLQPIDGNIGFFTLDNSPDPITIIMGNETFVLRNGRASTPDFASDADLVLVNRRPGKYKYYARNATGCVWTGESTLSLGGFQKINLQPCTNSKIIFYTRDHNAAKLPITVTLNEDDVVGNLASTQQNYDCGDAEASVLVADRQPGTYTYFATSADGKCLWTGKIELTSTQCSVVRLGRCNE